MPNKILVKFIKEARKKDFDDYEIKQIILKKGYPLNQIEEAFSSLKSDKKFKFKNKVCIELDTNVLNILEKRAKKNLFTISEQIEDILRRSCISSRKMAKETEKLDDMLVGLFSRKKYTKR